MAIKEALVKLQTKNLKKSKAKLDKMKEGNKKFKRELKQAKAALDKVRDSAIDLARENSHLLLKSLRKG